jgi:nucleoside triphosphate diphosphatase
MSDPRTALADLLVLMARLRDPEQGCPWDLQQTFASIAPFTIEEAYEVADAVERREPSAIRDELGDLLFQVVFHARMAEELGWFDFADVARAIQDKLVRRHPHIFAPASAGGALSTAELSRTWEEQKAQERAARAHTGVLDDVPQALPALARAAKLAKRAGRVGFDWQRPEEVRAKVLEEVGELTAASAAADAAAVAEEAGDALFAMACWVRHLGLDPEAALRAANSKFERRFRAMEALAAGQNRELTSLSAAEWDTLWNDVKKSGAEHQ